MNVTRITGLAALAASIALSACGGAGAPTTTNPAPSQAVRADAYTGPPAATADVTAFQVNFWNNVRTQNRCGQCHNSTTPAQLPNFARSDDVNLAYAQANTVVNLATPSTSIIVTKVAGGHNCWLADAGACGQILTTWITNSLSATGAGPPVHHDLSHQGGRRPQLLARRCRRLRPDLDDLDSELGGRHGRCLRHGR